MWKVILIQKLTGFFARSIRALYGAATFPVAIARQSSQTPPASISSRSTNAQIAPDIALAPDRPLVLRAR